MIHPKSLYPLVLSLILASQTLQAAPFVESLPEIAPKEDQALLKAEIQKKLEPHRNKQKLTDQTVETISERMRHYMSFLGLESKDFIEAAKDETPPADDDVNEDPPKTDDDDAEAEKEDPIPSNLRAIKRLFQASTQFLSCENLTDWECLEQPSLANPTAKYRVQAKADLGAPVPAGDSLDMEVFFTKAWDGVTPSSGVAQELAKRVSGADKSLSMAIFGIDDIEGSMKPVYDAIKEQSAKISASVRAVVDLTGIEKRPEGISSWIFSYTRPADESLWLFGGLNGAMRALFQYDGTPALIRLLNADITSNHQARVRVEWPPSNIMHNKFLVLESESGAKSVWSGTANVSKNCMGTERNANMAIHIKNDLIAQAFQDHFNQMYEIDSSVKALSKLVINPSLDSAENLPVGRFHHNKTPRNQRLFTFTDGTQMRVQFAPIDDAEHRTILPMLLSAGPGDIIRVSMFGGTGYEIVRAFQYAAARGADVRIAFDRKLGHGLTSWIRDSRLNVKMDNPYIGKVGLPKGVAAGKITVRLSTWDGKNHYKVGSLSRVVGHRRGGKPVYRTTNIIIGSQNWSAGGNDENDENLVAIQNLKRGIKSGDLFNKEFDEHIWPNSR